LACHPAVSDLVELDDGVTLIVGLADVAKTLPEVVPVEWASEDCARPLVEHRVLEVDPLHHLRIADGQVGVARSALNLVAAETISDAEHIHPRELFADRGQNAAPWPVMLGPHHSPRRYKTLIVFPVGSDAARSS